MDFSKVLAVTFSFLTFVFMLPERANWFFRAAETTKKICVTVKAHLEPMVVQALLAGLICLGQIVH